MWELCVCVESPPPSHRKKYSAQKSAFGQVGKADESSISDQVCSGSLHLFHPLRPPPPPDPPSFSFVRCTLLCTLRHLFFREATPLGPSPFSLAHLRSWFSLLCTLGAFAQNQRGGGGGRGALPRKRNERGGAIEGSRFTELGKRRQLFVHIFFLFLLSSLLDRECLGFQTR